MRLRVEQVVTILVPALHNFFPLAATPSRDAVCVTVLRDLSELAEAVAGELAIVEPNEGGGVDLDLSDAVPASQAAMVVLPGEFVSPRARRQLASTLTEHGTALGLLSCDAEPRRVANRLSRILTASPADSGSFAFHEANTLQEIAETLGRLVQNSVTIETPQHTLLAFSPAGRDVDRVREETILKRHGSRPVNTWAEREGYFAAMRKSDWPVKIPARSDLNFSGRVIMRVAMDDELLAIVWVTDTARALGEREYGTIREAAGAAASALLRQRTAMQREAEARAEFIEDVVQGRITSPDNIRSVARSLGWNIDQLRQALVVSIDNFEAFRVRYAKGAQTRIRRARERLLEIVRLEVLAADPNAIVGLLGASVIVLFDPGEPDVVRRREGAVQLGNQIVRRASSADLGVTVGVGRDLASFDQLAESCRQATLAAELGRSLWGGHRTIHYDDLGIHRLLHALREHDEMVPPALARLVEYDARHGTEYLATLSSYFSTMGRPKVMAEQLGVHRNTVDYRMARIEELIGTRLDDPQQRLSLELGAMLIGAHQARNPIMVNAPVAGPELARTPASAQWAQSPGEPEGQGSTHK